MMKAGFIGFMPFGLDFEGTLDILKKYKELGYSATEHATFLLNGDVEENKKKLADIGVEALCVGIGRMGAPSYTDEDIKTAIQNAKASVYPPSPAVSVCIVSVCGIRLPDMMK